MEQAKLGLLQRHDFLYISPEGRQRLAEEFAKECSPAIKEAVLDMFSFPGKGSEGIPGIVRRVPEDRRHMAPVGFVPPRRFQGQRLRIASFVKDTEVVKKVTPYEVLQQEVQERTPVLKAVREVAAVCGQMEFGVIGSAGLEILTGIPYTNLASDLDLVIGPHPKKSLQEIWEVLQKIGEKYALPIDLEVALPNGYGIKAAELFMHTSTLLGKGSHNVTLLARDVVETMLDKPF